MAEIRELTTESEWRDAFPVLSQLRSHLTEESYLEYLDGMCEEGYRLFALFEADEIVSVAGVAIRTNFYEDDLDMERYCYTFKKELDG